MDETNRFSGMDTETLVKYRTACERTLQYQDMPNIEECLRLLERELGDRKAIADNSDG